MARPSSRKPVAVLLIGRHGRVNTSEVHPLTHEGQGRFTLTPEAIAEARDAGRQVYNYLVRRRVLPHVKESGLQMHFRPSPYARAIQTAKATGERLEELLKKSSVPVIRGEDDLHPSDAVSFVHMDADGIIPHYPKPGSSEEEKAIELEEKWAAGASVPGWEGRGQVSKRTRAVLQKREEIQAEQRLLRQRRRWARQGSRTFIGQTKPIHVFGWVSHGPGRDATKLTSPSSPLGFAVSQLFTRKEMQKFRIPTELVRGHYVAAVLYDDGSIHAQHIKPRPAKN